MASRMGWLLGEERSALYPAALIAAITVNRLGLASIDPASAARAAAGRQVITTVAITKRSNGSALNITSLPHPLLTMPEDQLHASHDRPPGHGDPEDLLVGGVCRIGHLEVRMYRPVGQSRIEVPERVGIAASPIQSADACAQNEVASRRDLPGEYAGVHRVIERVLRHPNGNRVLLAVKGGIAQIEGVNPRRRIPDRRLHAAKVQVLNIEGAVNG